ncbi:mitochondrial acidic protein MAM33-like isoform X2 [Vigna umbellata]|uniref:mitochondrial acidic protein MAM33-like isoform X2 n=1 Tax=Vigna umbellata TaxID=87088 RepID=UPI001F5F1B11|nr:mitochondrial acidic protein MAM33-like isoform X2 [Vigna umbellata]
MMLLGRVREVKQSVVHLRHLCHNPQRYIQDLELLKCFKSEIQFELSSNHFQNAQTGSLGDFVMEPDSLSSKDVVLRRKFDSGEEVAVSAILGPPNYEEDTVFPRDAFMKVSPTFLKPSNYRGPLFSTLDNELQHALKEYLIVKGIGVSLTNFLLHYLHKREQEQYVNWLKKGEAAFSSTEGSLRQSVEALQ